MECGVKINYHVCELYNSIFAVVLQEGGPADSERCEPTGTPHQLLGGGGQTYRVQDRLGVEQAPQAHRCQIETRAMAIASNRSIHPLL
jgi:hypothetical protein